MRTSTRAAQDHSQYMQPDYRVPFHVAAVGEEEVAAVSEVIRSGWLTMGPKTFEFERQFGTYVGASHAMAVSTWR
jgi:dTDP-4-amino-4,6-dideoxygalactose transaminase